jgi:signal transduction histidine kinase
MAGLGTMAAGFAHELNNPAAAASRSTAQLREAVGDLENASWGLLDLALTPTQRAKLRALRDEIKQHPAPSAVLDPLAASDLEEAAADWLDERGVEDAWELAPMIAQLQWDEAALDQLLADFSPAQLPVVLRWLAAGGLVSTLVDEIGRSVGGISEIVKSVKDYSYLDQAAIQEINLQESLDNTLVLMRHKLEGGIIVQREYGPDLPKIEAYGSELNQVWTNLIDNAADAMGGQGHLTVRTRVHEDDVVVEITDTGPGIPDEIQPRIFDPFYTTKPAGVGTGLGLHIVYNIVAHRHHGQIDVTSRPGETSFRVTLPQRLTLREPAAVA